MYSYVAEMKSMTNRFFAVFLATNFFYCSPSKAQVADGAIRLWRNGITLRTYTFGRVQIAGSFGRAGWGNICGNTRHFSIVVADVICHQLGYTHAMGFSRDVEDGLGTDAFPLVFRAEDCHKNYLTIGQCSAVLNSSISDCVNGVDDASVRCEFVFLWNNPYNGMVRLFQGNHSIEGLLEVYCNGQWGTVCEDEFNDTTADVVCAQLGYTGARRYSFQSKRLGFRQPILYTSSCSSEMTPVCVLMCGMCSHMPGEAVCSQSKIVSNLVCENVGEPVNTTISTCARDESVLGIVVGTTVASGVLLLTIVAASVTSALICWTFHKLRSRQTNGIYEPIDLLSIPPQLPPRPLQQTIATQENPAYVKVDLTENPAYMSIKTENRVSLTLEAESDNHLGTGKDNYDDLESFANQHSMTAKLNEDRQSLYVELREAEIVLPVLVASATNPMFLSSREYANVASTMKLTCTTKPVRTISANNLTLSVEDSGMDDSACLNIRSKAFITRSKSATNIRTKVEEYVGDTIAQLTTIDHNTATRKDTEIAADSNSSNSSIT